jgi:hypothetical protein
VPRKKEDVRAKTIPAANAALAAETALAGRRFQSVALKTAA